jgi:acyl dehydratase
VNQVRSFDDLHAGDRVELGTVTVTEAEILEFARAYDPQPFHVDADAAARSPYGGLIASGWHTGSLFMRLLATAFLNDTDSLGSPGMEELRWPAPVRPGDTLRGELEILETRPSASRPEVGIVRSRGTLTNADGVTVLSLVATNFLGRSSA